MYQRISLNLKSRVYWI